MMTTMKLDFIGVGPMRAGTTWLHHALSQHPEIVLPREKETFYFDRYFDRGEAWYAAHFEERLGSALYGEIGASYFSSDAARERIYASSPGALIIVSVREPAERAFSSFIHLSKYERLSASLERALEESPLILESGRYSRYLPRWEERFGKERVHLLCLESAMKEPLATLNSLLMRLDLKPLDLDEAALRESKNTGFTARSYLYQRLSDRVFRALADNHHFEALDTIRRIKRRVERLPFLNRAGAEMRRMSDEERALLRRLLHEEYEFLSQRGLEY